MYGNRVAPSRDTATTFKVQEQLRFICAGGVLRSADRLVSGDSLKWSYLCICSIFVGEIHTFMYFSKFWVMRLHKQTNASLPYKVSWTRTCAVILLQSCAVFFQWNPEKGIYQPGMLRNEGACKMCTFHHTALHICTTYTIYNCTNHCITQIAIYCLLLFMPIAVAEWRTDSANSQHSIGRW